MNDETPNADSNELQFDKAEFAEPTTGEPVCAACRQTIPNHYFQLNGAILCEPCSDAVKARLTGGSFVRRFFKAGLFGFGAAIAGFAIYFGVLKLTGYEIGLISILVGYMVGGAVRNGSEGRGGLIYQLMAIFFTYSAIAVSYSALVIPHLIEKIKAERAEQVAAQAVKPNNAEVAENDNPAGKAENVAVKNGSKTNDEVVEPKAITPFLFLFGIGLIFAFVMALPILTGFEQPIGLLIVGFALWEAFKMNRKANVVITGPHVVGSALDGAPAHV